MFIRIRTYIRSKPLLRNQSKLDWHWIRWPNLDRSMWPIKSWSQRRFYVALERKLIRFFIQYLMILRVSDHICSCLYFKHWMENLWVLWRVFVEKKWHFEKISSSFDLSCKNGFHDELQNVSVKLASDVLIQLKELCESSAFVQSL